MKKIEIIFTIQSIHTKLKQIIMTQPIEAIEQFLKTRTPEQLSPDYLHAEISTSYYDIACETIKNVIVNGDRSGCLGVSSTREHVLYRAEDGTIYVVHFGFGKYIDAYYFTPLKIQMYFEYHDGEPPEFTLSEEVQANIKKYSLDFGEELGDELGDKMF